MKKITDAIDHHAENDLLPLEAALIIAEESGLTLASIEDTALGRGILPARYARNRNTISIDEQRIIFQSNVAVVGCGGLGGYIIEELARIGIGHITVVDPDTFEEHNLNRQLLAKIDTLGQSKVAVAAGRIKEVNPAVTVVIVQDALTAANGRELIGKVDVVADALDSIPRRLELAEVCEKCAIPLVHGSVGGWYGQVTTQFPGDNTLQKIYSGYSGECGIEKDLGNLSFVVPLIASIQVSEIFKILLNVGSTLRGKMLSLNLLDREFTEIIF